MVKWKAASARLQEAMETDESLVPPKNALSGYQIWLNQNREIIRKDHNPGFSVKAFDKKATELWHALSLSDRSVSIYPTPLVSMPADY